jgi:hypothetical protein
MTALDFEHLRFRFRALDAIRFPAQKSANTIRGAFGAALRLRAPEAYSALFEPAAHHPSGLANPPRPFVLRCAHLDHAGIAEGEPFYFDVHLFDLRAPWQTTLEAAFAAMASGGLGSGRGRAELKGVDATPHTVSLEPHPAAIDRVTLRFMTPTELKADGAIVERPEFAILIARIRDRLSTLRALYGPGPLDIEFRQMGERARAIRMVGCAIEWEDVSRKSGRTGQVHAIGGFTGEADYSGDLAEFLPWLRAAHWIGVGRQTVWGKGDVQVVE